MGVGGGDVGSVFGRVGLSGGGGGGVYKTMRGGGKGSLISLAKIISSAGPRGRRGPVTGGDLKQRGGRESTKRRHMEETLFPSSSVPSHNTVSHSDSKPRVKTQGVCAGQSWYVQVKACRLVSDYVLTSCSEIL